MYQPDGSNCCGERYGTEDAICGGLGELVFVHVGYADDGEIGHTSEFSKGIEVFADFCVLVFVLAFHVT